MSYTYRSVVQRNVRGAGRSSSSSRILIICIASDVITMFSAVLSGDGGEDSGETEHGGEGGGPRLGHDHRHDAVLPRRLDTLLDSGRRQGMGGRDGRARPPAGPQRLRRLPAGPAGQVVAHLQPHRLRHFQHSGV